MVKLKRDKSVDRLAFEQLSSVHCRSASVLPTFSSFQMLLFFIFVVFPIHLARSCPLTDQYLSRCHCGILTNSDSYIKCEENTLDHVPSFKRSFPYDELILSNNQIVNLTRSAFDPIKTIKRIHLQNNSLSSIDPDLLRLLGNYLEELILTGDDHIDSLEFLTRYPLKKLRILKLDHFNLNGMNLERILLNMTKLEIVHLRSCQLVRLPNLPHLQELDLENNQLAYSIHLSTSYVRLNLAQNTIRSIILEKNPQLMRLTLSKNRLNEFVSFATSNPKLKDLDLSGNALSSLDFGMFSEQLMSLNLDSNRFLSINFNELPAQLHSLSLRKNLIKQLRFSRRNASLLSLDLSENQLKTIEKNSLFRKLTHLNLQGNPLQCNCHLDWLHQLVRHPSPLNASTWTCQSSDTNLSPFLSADFQCPSLMIPRIVSFNISYTQISSMNGLLIQWSIVDDYRTIDFLQISLSEPFFLSSKLHPNQTQLFLTDQIEFERQYHICLLLFHRYARDKYCREIFTDKLTVLTSDEHRSANSDHSRASLPSTMNLHLMLIGSAMGGLLTLVLIFTCCYLCFQIQKYHWKKSRSKSLYQHSHAPYYSTNPNSHYPIYHSHSTTCPYHQENTSNSTDSSQIDTSLSTTASQLKHIYQTIDTQDYPHLNRQTELFDLWNQSLKHKR